MLTSCLRDVRKCTCGYGHRIRLNKTKRKQQQNSSLLTTNGLVENSAWSTEMEWTTGWINVTTFTQVSQILDFVSVKEKKNQTVI